MPFGDGTGPLGKGPRTGRGAGLCSGMDFPGWLSRGGMCGRGRGGGRWRNRQGGFGWPSGAPGRDDEADALKAQAGFFERALKSIRERIEGQQPGTKSE